MNLISDDSRFFRLFLPQIYVLNIGKRILESSETKFMNLPPYIFYTDHVAKIKSITVLKKKFHKITA